MSDPNVELAELARCVFAGERGPVLLAVAIDRMAESAGVVDPVQGPIPRPPNGRWQKLWSDRIRRPIEPGYTALYCVALSWEEAAQANEFARVIAPLFQALQSGELCATVEMRDDGNGFRPRERADRNVWADEWLIARVGDVANLVLNIRGGTEDLVPLAGRWIELERPAWLNQVPPGDPAGMRDERHGSKLVAGRFQGRPNLMPKPVFENELRARAERGEMLATLVKECEALRDWFIGKFPMEQPPTAKTIENGLREIYRSLKKAP